MIKAPKHLKSKSARDFFNKIVKQWEFEDHHITILTLACECLDQIETARLKVEKEGSYYINRFDEPRTHPAVKELKDNKLIFTRLIKQLNLEIEPRREVGRPPGY